MKNVLIMAVSDSFQCLQDNVANDVLAHSRLPLTSVGSLALVFSNQIEYSSFDQFKDKVEFIPDTNDFF
jgi:hypothetical protein